MFSRKEFLYLVGFFLLGNPINANLDLDFNYNSLENKAKVCSENSGGIRGRKDKDVELNIDSFIQIESSGNPFAENKRSGARGLMQIVPSVLKEWNHFHPNQKYELDDLFNSRINVKIGTWYLDKIKNHYLPYYGIKPSIENIIIAYNWGIGNLKKTTENRNNLLRSMSEPGEPNFEGLKIEDGRLVLENNNFEEYVWNILAGDDKHFLRTKNRKVHIPKDTEDYIERYKSIEYYVSDEKENPIQKYRDMKNDIRDTVSKLLPGFGSKKINQFVSQPIKHLHCARRKR